MRVLADESAAHGDILIERFYESYLNLTVKSLMLVKFAATYDIDASFVFKVSLQKSKESVRSLHLGKLISKT
jgi:hypothetical protein